jgi:hypothetical protein
MLINDSSIHRYPWKGNNTSQSVNPKLAKAIIPYSSEDFLEVFMIGDGPYQGALVSCDRPVPLIDGAPLSYARARWMIWPSLAALQSVGQFECDTLVVWPPAPNSTTPLANKPDGSSQVNMAKGGVFQIDKVNPDKSGPDRIWNDSNIKPGTDVFPSNTFSDYIVDYKFDWTKQTISVLAAKIGNLNSGKDIDPALQNVPFQTSNWSRYIQDPQTGKSVPAPLLKMQAQMNLVGSVPAGSLLAVSCRYRLDFEWSDNLNFD